MPDSLIHTRGPVGSNRGVGTNRAVRASMAVAARIGAWMPDLTKLPTWADKRHVYSVVETPRGSRAKLEFDAKLGAFTLSKPLLAGLDLSL